MRVDPSVVWEAALREVGEPWCRKSNWLSSPLRIGLCGPWSSTPDGVFARVPLSRLKGATPTGAEEEKPVRHNRGKRNRRVALLTHAAWRSYLVKGSLGQVS